MVLGSQAAHGIAYWWAYPQASLRVAVLQETGHGYLAFAPVVFGVATAVEAALFVVLVVVKVRGDSFRGLPAWAFLGMPAIGFVVQELFERFLSGGVFSWRFALEPTFWRGLALQLPVGLAAYLIARLLLGAASSVAELVPPVRPALVPSLPRATRQLWIREFESLIRPAPLAAAAAGRAPPPRS
jgi:hypothetical protein